MRSGWGAQEESELIASCDGSIAAGAEDGCAGWSVSRGLSGAVCADPNAGAGDQGSFQMAEQFAEEAVQLDFRYAPGVSEFDPGDAATARLFADIAARWRHGA